MRSSIVPRGRTIPGPGLGMEPRVRVLDLRYRTRRQGGGAHADSGTPQLHLFRAELYLLLAHQEASLQSLPQSGQAQSRAFLASATSMLRH